MEPILLSKEFVEMIEDRIPGGKYLTTTALTLVVLALITAASVYLYRMVVHPVVTLIVVGLSSGTLSSSTLINVFTSIAAFGLLLLGSHYLFGRMIKLVVKVTDMFETVVREDIKMNEALGELAATVKGIEVRVALLEKIRL